MPVNRSGGPAVTSGAACEIADRAVRIAQRIDRPGAEGVTAEVVRDRQAGQRGGTGIDEIDHIGDRVPHGVGRGYGRLADGEHLADLARDDVRADLIAAVGEGCDIGKGSHRNSSRRREIFRARRGTAPLYQIMPPRGGRCGSFRHGGTFSLAHRPRTCYAEIALD